MKITYEKSPYGDEGKTYKNEVEMMDHYILQLKTFRNQPSQTAKSKQAIDDDIAGYEEVKQSGSEYNAKGFLTLKEKAHRGLRPMFKNNLDVIKTMKDNGVWEVRQ